MEFAIVAVPFFFIIYGIFEMGLIFWASYELEDATITASRLVLTGQAQNQGFNQTAFKAQVCANVVILSNCTSVLQVDVETFSSFGAITAPTPTDKNGNLNTTFAFNLGGPSQIMLITTFYEWPLSTPMTSLALSNLTDGNFLLRSAAAFRNEPYSQAQQ